jgi:hypothetical protein
MALIGESAIDMEPIETDNIGSLAQLILPELPGCGDLVVRQQLGYALREFCRETDACVVTHEYCFSDGEEMPNGAKCFHLCGAPSGMIVGTVLDVCCDGCSVPFDVFGEAMPKVAVQPYYGASGKATVRFSVYPKVGGEACPRWFKERYAEAITAGAMVNLLSMSGKAWSDPQRAAQYSTVYQGAIAEATYRRMNGGVMSSGLMDAIPQGGLFM